MPKFRVREEYRVRGWTYVEAEDKENAEAKLQEVDIANCDFREDYREHEDIEWETLEEVQK